MSKPNPANEIASRIKDLRVSSTARCPRCKAVVAQTVVYLDEQWLWVPGQRAGTPADQATANADAVGILGAFGAADSAERYQSRDLSRPGRASRLPEEHVWRQLACRRGHRVFLDVFPDGSLSTADTPRM